MDGFWERAGSDGQAWGVPVLPARWVPAEQLSDLPLGHALIAHCDCGTSIDVDIRHWTKLGLADVRFERLEDRLRCSCGARHVALTVARQNKVSHRGGGKIWLTR